MKHLVARWGMAAVLLAAVVGCGGGGSNGQTIAVPPPPVAISNAAIAAASVLAANDTATNAAAPFAVLQGAGLPAFSITNGPPVVNFTVFSDGQVLQGLAASNVRVALAKLVPAASGNPDEWVSYVNRVKTSGTTNATQATTDPTTSVVSATSTTTYPVGCAASPATLAYNSAGYYSYKFCTDVKQTKDAKGNLVFDAAKTHRVVLQLSYTNKAGATVRVNPYFDFTLDANGNSVALTNAAQTRKMADIASCNNCHEKLVFHGGRVDTQYCVVCHNPGTTDPVTGNVVTFSTMVHKIHAGKRLAAASEPYIIGRTDFSEVGFPQDLRNCAVCHSGTNPKTPQGDNWKTSSTKEACLSCHASGVNTAWGTLHAIVAGMRYGSTAPATALTNADCADCHKTGSVLANDRVHWNQVQANAAKYKMNIESVAFNDTADHKARSVTVKYFLSDPTNGNVAYNLVTADCTLTCGPATKFGNLSLYLAYQNMVGQSDAVTEFSAYNNGGSGAAVYAYSGVNDGNNHYTASIAIPDDVADLSVAKGTARVVSIGQVVERKLSALSVTDPRPEAVPASSVNTLVQHAYQDVALTGPQQPRRAIVSNEKCNVCHGALGAASASNTLANAFHSGARNTVQACVVCHDANRMSSTVMTNGMALNESYQFKRMIHGIHGGAKRAYPFTHGNPVQGQFLNDGTLLVNGNFLSDYAIRRFTPTPPGPVIPAGTSVAAGKTFNDIANMINTAAGLVGYAGTPQSIENYAAEVQYPGALTNCNACHVNDSYKIDHSPLGAVVQKAAGVTDSNQWKVISPKAASCMACHDGNTKSGVAVVDHVRANGASFGELTQAQVATSMTAGVAVPRETCDDCHSSGLARGVDKVHGLQ